MIKFPPGLNFSRWNKKTPYFSQSSCFERQPFLTVLYDPKLKSVQLSILEANQLCLKKLLKRIFFKMFVKIANLISLSQNLLQILHNVISILTSIYLKKKFLQNSQVKWFNKKTLIWQRVSVFGRSLNKATCNSRLAQKFSFKI